MAFAAEVFSAGQGGHAVLVPPGEAAALSSKRPAVIATVNGTHYRTRLMVYGGKSYLGLRQSLLRQLGVGVGDRVQVELREDPEPPAAVADQTGGELLQPPELSEALAADPAVRTAYDALPDPHRIEYARWVAGGDQSAVRAERATRIVRRLRRT